MPVSAARNVDRPSSRNRCAAPGLWSIPSLVRGAVGDLEEGSALGAWTITQLRGTQSHCEVYLVTHSVDGSTCMARVASRAALAGRAGLAGAMLAAANRLARANHPNVLEVRGFGWTAEPAPRPYVLHERVVGRDLASYQARHERLEAGLLVAIATQCAAALKALHTVGLAHCELWRGAAMLVPVAGDQFRVKLGAFEHARAIRPGATAHDEPLVAADLAALGAMLDELAEEVSDTPAALTEVIVRLTSTDVRRRFYSAASVEEALKTVAAAWEAAAPPEPAPEVEAAPRRPRRFGEVSLVMPVERPVEPIRLAATPWLSLWIVVVSVVGILLAAMLGGRTLSGASPVRDLEVGRDEPTTAWAPPPTVPAAPPPASPEVSAPSGGAPKLPLAGAVSRGKCEDHEPAPRTAASPRKRPAPTPRPVIETLPALPTVEASPVPAALPTVAEPPVARAAEDDGLMLLPTRKARTEAADQLLPAGGILAVNP